MRRVAIEQLANLLRTRLAAATERARSQSTLTLAAGSMSALLHVMLIVLVMSTNVRAGDPNALPVVLVENFAPRSPIRDPQRAPAEDPPSLASEEESAPPELSSTAVDVPSPDTTLAETLQQLEPPAIPTPTFIAEVDESALTYVDAQNSEPAPPTPPTIDLPRTRTVEIAPEHQSNLIERLANAAQALTQTQQTEVLWTEDGREYRAVLKRALAENSMELETISADVTTTDQGMSMQTQLLLSRLAFSQFTQVVDR